MKVIFEDNHLLVVDKPAGIPTQDAPNHSESLEAQAKAYLKEKYQKEGNVYLHAVHRLDKDVSGVVLFAKTSKALSRLNASIREKRAKKRYQAQLDKAPEVEEQTLEHKLMKGEHKAHVDERGRLCRLSYKVIERSLVEITLETGRYHQIRAQFAAIGCPIVGDRKYGSENAWEKGIALCHTSLTIPHPITGDQVTFDSLLPMLRAGTN